MALSNQIHYLKELIDLAVKIGCKIAGRPTHTQHLEHLSLCGH